MPYTNVHIFQEKVAKSFSKKKFEPLNLMKKIIQIKIIDFSTPREFGGANYTWKIRIFICFTNCGQNFLWKIISCCFMYNYEFQNLDSLEEYLKYFAYNAPYLFKSF
jgi:hypothetical protein